MYAFDSLRSARSDLAMRASGGGGAGAAGPMISAVPLQKPTPIRLGPFSHNVPYPDLSPQPPVLHATSNPNHSVAASQWTSQPQQTISHAHLQQISQQQQQLQLQQLQLQQQQLWEQRQQWQEHQFVSQAQWHHQNPQTQAQVHNAQWVQQHQQQYVWSPAPSRAALQPQPQFTNQQQTQHWYPQTPQPQPPQREWDGILPPPQQHQSRLLARRTRSQPRLDIGASNGGTASATGLFFGERSYSPPYGHRVGGGVGVGVGVGEGDEAAAMGEGGPPPLIAREDHSPLHQFQQFQQPPPPQQQVVEAAAGTYVQAAYERGFDRSYERGSYDRSYDHSVSYGPPPQLEPRSILKRRYDYPTLSAFSETVSFTCAELCKTLFKVVLKAIKY